MIFSVFFFSISSKPSISTFIAVYLLPISSVISNYFFCSSGFGDEKKEACADAIEALEGMKLVLDLLIVSLFGLKATTSGHTYIGFIERKLIQKLDDNISTFRFVF